MAIVKSKYLTERFSTDVVRAANVTCFFKGIDLGLNVSPAGSTIVLCPLGAEDIVRVVSKNVASDALAVSVGICNGDGSDYADIADSKSVLRANTAFATVATVLSCESKKVNELYGTDAYKKHLREKTPYLCLYVGTVSTVANAVADVTVGLLKGSGS